MKTIVTFLFTIYCTLLSAVALSADSVKPFLVLFGNKPYFNMKDVSKLAAYELLILERFRYHEVNGNTWAAIKSASPKTKIFLYQGGPLVANNQDTHSVYYLNNLGRFNKSRGSSLGSINKSHPRWFLKTAAGKPSSFSGYSTNLILDFSNVNFVDYWIEHTLEDISFQKWRADGIYIDNAIACRESISENTMDSMPAMFRDCKRWDKGMNDYLTRVSNSLYKEDQLVAANRGNSRYATGTKAWQELDQIRRPLDLLLEEGAFAVHWGDSDVLFLREEEWRRQIDLPASIKRSTIGMMSHTDLAPNETGRTEDGEPVSYGQVLRFSVGSYLLARNIGKPTTYFMFIGNKDKNDYLKLIPSEMYNEFDIGTPIAKYNRLLDESVYFRKYSDGYVYVNPTNKRIRNIELASGFRPEDGVKHVRKIGSAWYLDLPPHDAAILSRADPATLPKSPSFRLE